MSKYIYKILTIGLTIFAYNLISFAAPYAGYTYPSSIQRGTTQTIIVGGQYLATAGKISSSDKVKIVATKKMPNIPRLQKEQRQYTIKCLKLLESGDKNLPERPEIGDSVVWRDNIWLDNLASLNSLELALVTEKSLNIPDPLQTAPSIAEKLLVTLEIAEDCPEGLYSLRFYARTGISNPVNIYVTAHENYQEPFYKSPFRTYEDDTIINQIPATVNGIIQVKDSQDEFEFELKKDGIYHFELIGRTLKPFIGDGVPGHFQATLTLVDENGKVIGFADDYFYNPDPVLEVKIPKTGKYRLIIKDSLSRGREDFVYIVNAKEGKYINKERNFANLEKIIDGDKFNGNRDNLVNTKQDINLKNQLKPNQKDYFYFAGEANEELVISTKSLYDYSMFDSVLKVYNAENKLIAQNDDYVENYNIGKALRFTDSYLKIKLPESGIYTIEVADQLNNGGENYKYILSITHTLDDFQVYTTTSQAVAKNQKFSVKFIVNKSKNFPHDIEITAKNAEAVGSNIIKKDEKDKSLTFTTRFARPNSANKIEFVATTVDDNGVVTKKDVIYADESMQAFAYDHYVEADDFYLYTQGQARNNSSNQQSKRQQKQNAK